MKEGSTDGNGAGWLEDLDQAALADVIETLRDIMAKRRWDR